MRITNKLIRIKAGIAVRIMPLHFRIIFLSLRRRYANRINRKKSIPTKLLRLVSGHIIFISAIPIFFNGMYLLYHIIPHRFLETIIEFLYEFGFIFLGYYFLLFVGILIFGFLIFFIQRNASRREQLKKELKEKTHYIRAFNQNKCPNCQNRVEYKTQKHCGYCSERLVRTCGNCGEDTPKHLEYCIECGNMQPWIRSHKSRP